MATSDLRSRRLFLSDIAPPGVPFMPAGPALTVRLIVPDDAPAEGDLATLGSFE